MKNLVGYTPLQNPDWIALRFEDGTESTPVHDPAGEYRAEVDQIAKKIAGVPPDPMQNATASLGGELAAGAGASVAKADVAAPVSGLGDFRIIDPPAGAAKPVEQGGDAGAIRGALKTAMRVEGPAGMPSGGAPGASAAAPTPQPTQPPPSAGPAPLVTTGSTSSWQKNDSTQRSSSGISEADLPKVQAANAASLEAQKEANQADYAAKASQVFSEWGRLSEKAKEEIAQRNELQSQEMVYNQKLESAYKKYDEDMKRPIDPAQAFAGEKRWYAFMAGFGDVLRNVGAALAGKGPVVDPGKVLDDLVERSVQLQMAQKEQALKAGRLNIDQFNADRAYTRGKLGAVISQLAQTELDKAQTEQVYKGLGAIKAKGDALVANSGAEYAKATARQETIAESHSKTSGGSTERAPARSGNSLDELSKLLDIEKKQIELRNAKLDSATTDDVEAAIGKKVSPERAKQIRETVKQSAEPLAKLASFQTGVERQLVINGATVDWENARIVWPEDLAGVSAIQPSDILVGPVGESVRKGFNTKEEQLRQIRNMNVELLTTDTTGAVTAPDQKPVFMEAFGGDIKSEAAYKTALENTVRHLSARKHAYLTSMGPEGAAFYLKTEQDLKNAEAAKLRELGVLPEGKR